MTPRKQHLKSRKGCMQCKRRKIKCDERPPLCGPCQKHRISCSYGDQALTPRSTTSSDPVICAGTGTPASTSASTSTHPISPPPTDLQYANPLSPDTLLTLELLQNFTSHTYLTITSSIQLSPSMAEFYRSAFVREALAYPYFTHALLAVSAFHIVYFIRRGQVEKAFFRRPLEAYLIAAHTHHNTALRSLRDALDDISAENASAAFGTAVLITLVSFAQPDIDTSFPPPPPTSASTSNSNPEFAPALVEAPESPRRVSKLILDWFALIRGMDPAYTSFKTAVQSGPLAPIFASKIDYGSGAIDPEISSNLDALCLAFSQRSTPHVKTVCGKAVETLKVAFAGVGERRESSSGLGWVYNVEEGFVRLLEGEVEEALVVLGWFCVLLGEMGGMWWAEGWAGRILGAVEGLLGGGGGEWVEWVRWPGEVVRRGRGVGGGGGGETMMVDGSSGVSAG